MITRPDPVSGQHWLEFVTEIEASIGKRATVAEWWQWDRERLISHMIGGMSVACRYAEIAPITRAQIVMLIESYLEQS